MSLSSQHVRDPSADSSVRREPWDELARYWSRLGTPLFPSEDDLDRLHRAWRASLGGDPPGRPLDILVLGLTAQFVAYPWAPAMRITALDASDVMIAALWPGDRPDRRAIRGDWLNMPCAGGSFDLVLCDNGPTLFDNAGLERLSKELRRVLRVDGRVLMRNFAPPQAADSLASLVAAVEARQIDNFHAFKIRWLMALQAAGTDGFVRLGEAWEHFSRAFPNRRILAARIGCSVSTISTIDAYRGSEGRYHFHPLAALARSFAEFSFQPGPPGSYPFAGCCPVFSLTPLA